MNASTMYSKDTALSSGKQQSRRDEAAEEEEEKKESSVQKDKVRFKGSARGHPIRLRHQVSQPQSRVCDYSQSGYYSLVIVTCP